MCGEKVARLSAMLMPVGSPPRVRGKVQVCSGVVSEQRITPACAGKRFLESVHNRQKEDHPRVCGEKAVLPMWTNTRLGSPPRVRGKAFSYSARSRAVGITPACAGKSTLRKTAGSTYRDHPRVCGEKAAERAEVGKGRGSPPRVRGKGCPAPPHQPARWITPACAGKRDFPCVGSLKAKDHPRVCGEKTKESLKK